MRLTPADFLRARILIVDDQPANILLLERILAGAGYSCITSTTDPFAVCRLHQTHQYDLILLDLKMPGMDGFEVMEALKKLDVDSYVPVLVITAEPNHKVRALQAGAKDFIGKPFDIVEVKTRIHNMLEVRLQHQAIQNYSESLEQIVLERTADLQRFRQAMNLTADAIFLLNRSTMLFIDVNDSACRMFGYTREELYALGPMDLSCDSRETLERRYDETIATGQSSGLFEVVACRRDGTQFPAELQRQVQRRGDDWVIIVILRDITERKDAHRRLQRLAHYDPLTGLPNRTLFYETLAKTLAQAEQNQWRLAVLFIDLDRFKNINDTLGHAIGDELLRQFCDRLAQCVRVRDTVGRLGGDEFALILIIPHSQLDAVVVANKIREVLRHPFDLRGFEASITASIGITLYPDDARDPETLVKYADTAMYKAKEAGRNTYRFFTADMNLQVLARLELENALHKAIENEEFVLYYQPKLQINTGRMVGVEALIRWVRPGHGMVSPGEFIPLLEETGLIVRVGAWVIEAACRQLALWTHSWAGPIPISVNVSGRQFLEGNLEQVVLEAIRKNNIEPDCLELELTESSLMFNTEQAITELHRLKALGIQISIDDFGTGYSSLAYLKRFPIDKLKIDIAFIREVTTNPDDAAIALAIINMAHSLKLQVIAEGVETAAQLSYLRRHRCDQMQGFYFSQAVSCDALERMRDDEKCLPPAAEEEPLQIQTLLLVDDEPSVLTALRRVLRQDGYHILTASSAAEGFELLALNPVQVILCDQRMLGMSGTLFLDRVKDLYPDTFRIVLTVQTDLESILEAVNRGSIYRFYTKPWDNKTLRANIREAFLHYWRLHGLDFDGAELVDFEEVDAEDEPPLSQARG